MIPASSSDRIVVEIVELFAIAIAAAAAYVAVRELPSFFRYLHITRMANGKHVEGPTPHFEAPEYAQAPRRAGERDRNRGHDRV